MTARFTPTSNLPAFHSYLYHRPRRRQPAVATTALQSSRDQHTYPYYTFYHRARLRPHRNPHFRSFHTSIARPQKDQPDHYTTLSLPSTASSKDIKKQFYSLSKKHHPDVTRNLPESEAAAHRQKFEAVSDAYHTLGNPDKKTKYDRERAPASTPNYGAATSAQSSRSGRPASGLSRRRGTFRGPPPSFYKSGGWGTGGSSRSRREDADDTGQRQHAYARSTHHTDQGPGASGEATGDGDGSWPFTTDPNDVPHFDRGSHYRTTTNIESQLRQGRERRRNLLWKARSEAIARGSGSGADAIFSPEEVGMAKEMRSFSMVVGLLVMGCGGGWLLFGR